ncbi:MAG TPA: ASPIC/UnbV domain-containing protein, partial [Candidatus Latescibacteria bacterium]|nr:ASPIC/UnbV domain-containing protein [Candidatus Latescibacterota bacterium]
VRVLSGGRWKIAEKHSGSSYASTEDPRLLFGLGVSAGADSVEVEWPSGARGLAVGIPANSTVTFREGRGYDVSANR